MSCPPTGLGARRASADFPEAPRLSIVPDHAVRGFTLGDSPHLISLQGLCLGPNGNSST